MIELAGKSFTSQSNSSAEVVDLLVTRPSQMSFPKRVQSLQLTRELEHKAIQAASLAGNSQSLQLTADEEKELATEVLLLRHRFTEIVWQSKLFSQAALSVIQNIYLFRNRKIFFDPSGSMYEEERKEALHLFTSRRETASLPLGKTFQHLIIARVWNRITSGIDKNGMLSEEFEDLEKVVQRLNTIRNIYVLLSTGLVKKITSQVSRIYGESLTPEDAHQVGYIGVARASYRYHQSSGVRFSTYAGHWIKKEIQRQSLAGRLIRISTNTVELYATASKMRDEKMLARYGDIICKSTCVDHSTVDAGNIAELSFFSKQNDPGPERNAEEKELKKNINQLVRAHLSEKERDVIQRRFALFPYQGVAQSIIEIANHYGVTRSSIYQLERKALKKLERAFRKAYDLSACC